MQINGYLYDTHVHTSEGSACGQNTGAEMARAYQKAGYAGIVVTDHFFYGNTAVDRSLPWKDWVEQFCKGYEHAKEEGDKIGLQVFFGWESGYHGTEFLIYGLNKEWLFEHPEIKDADVKEQFCKGYEHAKEEGDKIGLQVFFGWESGYHGTEFLIYGLNKEWLFEHPEIKDADVKEQYELVHAGGGIVSHAHPFREEDYIPEIRLFPDCVDAVEGINATHESPASTSHKNILYNEKAIAYAKEHGLPITAGSDQHTTRMIGGGMLFDRKLSDEKDFCRAVLAGEAKAYWNGSEFYG